MKLLSIGQCATLACLWEATVPKPGNVHRGADFEDVSFGQFVTSAVAIGPAMEVATARGVGRTVLDAVRATRRVVSSNTNLGTVLLLAPLAAVPRSVGIAGGVSSVLRSMGAEDAQLVYEAIREAQPGGLGRVAAMDVAQSPPDDLFEAMRAAASWDLVARQYAEDYRTLLEEVVPWLEQGLVDGATLTDAVIHAHLQLMQAVPDSLIARKCGQGVAEESAARAAAVLAVGPPGAEAYRAALADLDFWLRCDSHRRNPGTTADMMAAGLFVLLRDEIIKWPVSGEW